MVVVLTKKYYCYIIIIIIIIFIIINFIIIIIITTTFYLKGILVKDIYYLVIFLCTKQDNMDCQLNYLYISNSTL